MFAEYILANARLIDAIREGNFTRVNRALDQGADPNVIVSSPSISGKIFSDKNVQLMLAVLFFGVFSAILKLVRGEISRQAFKKTAVDEIIEKIKNKKGKREGAKVSYAFSAFLYICEMFA